MSVFDNLMDLQRQINTQQTLLNQILRVDRPSVSPVSIISIKYAEFTGTQSASVGAGGNVAITDLSITHAMAKSTNKLLFSAFVGQAANSLKQGNVAIAIADDGTLIKIADAASARSRVTAGGIVVDGTTYSYVVTMPHISINYEPGDISSHIYTLRAINLGGSTQTVYINRSQGDINDVGISRTISAIRLIELEG